MKLSNVPCTLSTLLATTTVSFAFPDISKTIGGFRGYLTNEVDFEQSINGVAVDTETKSEGISDAGTLIVEVKDTAGIYAPLSPRAQDWTILQAPTSVAKLKPKGISRDGNLVTGESETVEKQKKLFTWTPAGGFFFHEHPSFDMDEATIYESKGEGISRNGKYITGSVRFKGLNDTDREHPLFWVSDPVAGQDKVTLLPILSNATIMEESEKYISTLFIKKLKGSA